MTPTKKKTKTDIEVLIPLPWDSENTEVNNELKTNKEAAEFWANYDKKIAAKKT